MDIVLTVLRFLALVISILGFVLFVRVKWHISPQFSYLFVISAIACLIFFAGLASILLYAVWALFALGIGLFIYLSVRKHLGVIFNFKALNVLNIVFLAAFGMVFASLIGTRFIHYDNFSHWGVVVKDMLATNLFPGASSAMIDFKTYPLGTSSFIYFVCRIVGSSEGVMLVAQSMPIFACFYAMFGMIRDLKRLLLTSLLALCFISMTFFNVSIGINNLLVDFLLPMLALAAIAAIFASRDDFKMACITSAPILALLVIVKSSGVFFAAICFIYLIYTAFKAKKRSGAKRIALFGIAVLTIALSLITLLAWNLHTSGFDAATSKFSISSENLSNVYTSKTPDQVSAVIAHFVSAVLDLNSLATFGIVICNGLALVAYLVARIAFKKKWQLLKVLLVLDVAVLVYYAGILAMFLFTMPTDEALRLAGFERYASSIVLFLIGALALCAVNDVGNSFHVQQGDRRDSMAFKSLFTKNVYQYASMVFVAVSVFLLLSSINEMNSSKASYPDSLPARVQSVVGDNWAAQDGKRYLFYASDKDNQVSDYYLQYVGRYYLYAPQVDAVSTVDADTFMQQLGRYDYLVIIESDPAIAGFMRTHSDTSGGNGIYDVKATFK